MILYHGTTAPVEVGQYLLPPSVTGIVSEKGRKRNLDRVFLTADLGLARIYAGRAAQSLGGRPKVLTVQAFDSDVETLSTTVGATVFHASYGFVISSQSI